MRSTIVALLALVFAVSTVRAGEVRGTITSGNKPVAAGSKVEVTVAGKTYTAETDKYGSYRFMIKEKGKCTLTFHLGEQSASAELFSYDRSTRYDWVVENANGKLSLRRK